MKLTVFTSFADQMTEDAAALYTKPWKLHPEIWRPLGESLITASSTGTPGYQPTRQPRAFHLL
ncbi:MAG: hypothetical protein WAM70_13380 [Pyrinomonadaceae bacterium]